MAFIYGALVVVEELENEERLYADRLFRRFIRDAQDPFSVSDVEFISNYRLNKRAMLDLFEEIIPHMQTGHGSALRIPNHLRILATMNFFAVGSYQRNIGNNLLASMSQPMISRSIKEVAIILNRHCLRRWIQFPKNHAQNEVLKTKFRVMHRLPNIIGIVDGTHIAIVKPAENEHAYVNRKGYHSINVQIICDSDLKIISILARYPGSSHDSFVWRSSIVGRRLKANYENGDHNSRILGDSGYPCLPWLLVPLSHTRNEREERFNGRIKKVRSTVERCIGVLKGRFRCLLKDRTLHYKPSSAARIIMACAILHNIAIHYRLEQPNPVLDDIDVELLEHPDNAEADIMYRQLGQAARNQYILENF